MAPRLRTVVLAVVLATAGCTDAAPPSGTPSTPSASSAASSVPSSPPGVASAAPATALTGHWWSLVGYTVPGERPVRVRGRHPFVVEPSGRYHAVACNTFEGTMTVHDGYAELSGGGSTSKACGAEAALEDAVFRVFANRRIEWAVAGPHLVLRAPELRTLRYEAIDAAYPGRRARTLAAGTREGWTWRLYAQPMPYGLKVGVAVSDASGKAARGAGAGEGTPPGPDSLTVFTTPVGSGAFVGGFAPEGAVRVTHRLRDGREIELRTYDVPGTEQPAYGGVVPERPRAARVTAYGSEGTVLGRVPR